MARRLRPSACSALASLLHSRHIARHMPGLEFRVLGPVSVSGGNGDLLLPGGRRRALLALLLVNAGEVVPVGRIIEELWDGDDGSRRNLQVLVSRLRRDLGGRARIEASSAGYVLRTGEVDAVRFKQLAAET